MHIKENVYGAYPIPNASKNYSVQAAETNLSNQTFRSDWMPLFYNLESNVFSVRKGFLEIQSSWSDKIVLHENSNSRIIPTNNQTFSGLEKWNDTIKSMDNNHSGISAGF